MASKIHLDSFDRASDRWNGVFPEPLDVRGGQGLLLLSNQIGIPPIYVVQFGLLIANVQDGYPQGEGNNQYTETMTVSKIPINVDGGVANDKPLLILRTQLAARFKDGNGLADPELLHVNQDVNAAVFRVPSAEKGHSMEKFIRITATPGSIDNTIEDAKNFFNRYPKA